ncbi:MAG: S41 family peptidase [Candidatus Omnitrophota bacterium]
MKKLSVRILGLACVMLLAYSCAPKDKGLLGTYPTTLTEGYSQAEQAKPWRFTSDDIYKISRFSFSVGSNLTIECGESDLGVGHSDDGAVWAVVMPVEKGSLTHIRNKSAEEISHLWLRFHPAKINELFPPKTVLSGKENRELLPLMQRIANAKFRNSYHAGMSALIPSPPDMIVDADVKSEPPLRRFYSVDLKKKSIKYESFFQNKPLPPLQPITPEMTEKSFDQLWTAYDKQYPLFTLRPEVDWNQLKEQFRPQALQAKNSFEFAWILAKMLAPLRDLHIWIHIGKESVPVFNRPRSSNANPSALEAMIGKITKTGQQVHWGKTKEQIGYIAIWSWTNPEIPGQFDQALEEMRDVRGLIVDVRLNGGGSEDLAQAVAGRFLEKEVIYSYSQYRKGPAHGDLTEKMPRKTIPRGPWRFDRPTLILIGQKCMSSNESFICMMAEAPQATTMGDRTCGSSANPTIIDLPAGVQVSLPRWIDLLADGTPLDERGIQPDIAFEPDADAFTGKNDDLLAAALERLRHEPLPPQPIAGPSAIHAAAKKRAWSAEQVIGEPDVHNPGSSPAAWAPAAPHSPDEWLLLAYGEVIDAASAVIHENHHPGAVYKICALNPTEEEIELWAGNDPTPPDRNNGVSQIDFSKPAKIQRLKIYLDGSRVFGSGEIDAVGLIGVDGKTRWAVGADASSSFADIMEPIVLSSTPLQKRPWGPEQATGEPNTPNAGDLVTAWASLTQDGQREWLILEFEEPIFPASVKIVETFNPGAVDKVTLINENGEETEAWSGEDPTPPGQEIGVSEIKFEKSIQCQKIKIYIDSPKVPGWNEIDAVGLADEAGKTYWAVRAEASSSYAER